MLPAGDAGTPTLNHHVGLHPDPELSGPKLPIQAKSITAALILCSTPRHSNSFQPKDIVAIKDTNAELLKERQRIFTLAMASPAFRPVAVALTQALYENAEGSLTQNFERQAKAYIVWGERNCEVRRRLQASLL